MLRGNGEQDILFGPEDRYRLYQLLQEGTERFDYRMHGFCLMINHLHLAMQVAYKPLARCMQNLSFRYKRWVNDRQSRTGHLFQALQDRAGRARQPSGGVGALHSTQSGTREDGWRCA
ncbi:MAG: hypothetical protein GY792_37655 [Gammaproteobacteria bacterium]|nr:hypothetical protein [Gammaproteobacteria bacterium]